MSDRLEGGIYRLIQTAYNSFLREKLPRTWGAYAGVPAKDRRLLDLNTSEPDYKIGLIKAIREYCPGKDVELIGLGRGVSSVHMIRAGANKVVAYEAAGEMIKIARETFEACPYTDTDRVYIRHALVGSDIEVYGEDYGEPLSPESLTSPVLVMDCEGSEVSIIKQLDYTPEIIIVETHPQRGYPTETTEELLSDRYPNVERRNLLPHDSERHVLIATLD